MKTVDWKKLIGCLFFVQIAGIISWVISSNSMTVYSTIPKPFYAPPGWIFPVVWTILYLMMGTAIYLILEENSPAQKEAVLLFAASLIVNVLWPYLFFSLKKPMFAFVLLVALWIMIYLMIRQFRQINDTAAKLLYPYIIWVTYAAFLNLAYL